MGRVTKKGECWGQMLWSILALIMFLTAPASRAADLTVDGGATYTVNSDIIYDTEVIGKNSSGTMNQSGYTNTVNYSLFLGQNVGSLGIYNLSGGTLLARSEFIGFGMSNGGIFNQSGGINNLTTAYGQAGSLSVFGTYNLSGGSLSVDYETRINGGTFSQSGGSSWSWSLVTEGTYNLSDGTLSTFIEAIGQDKTGTFNQSGGDHVTNHFVLGWNSSGSGTYNLSGGSLSAGSERIGFGGRGTFNQSGGTNTTGLFIMGGYDGSISTYNLSGGSLLAESEAIGEGGQDTFNQSGGTNTTESLTIRGAYYNKSRGAYNLSGGNLIAGIINLNDRGTFNQTGGSLNAGVFNQDGGTVKGSLENRGIFNYSTGLFNGRLLNYGVINFNADFNAGNGLANFSSTPLAIASGRTVTLNGQGLDNQGNLVVNGLLTGNGLLLNNTSGILSGSGTIARTFINSGTVNPGNPVGTLNVSGSYTQTAGGNFLLGISSPRSYGRIKITGTASLDGFLTPVLLGSYRSRGNHLFSGILTATGGLTGTFTLNNPWIGPTLYFQPRYYSDRVDLLVRREYNNPGLGLNSNQSAVGAMLNGLAGTTFGDLGTVLDAVDNLPSSSGVQDAFKQISPDKAGSLATLGFAGAAFQMRNLAIRTTNLRFRSGTFSREGGLGSLDLNYSRLNGVMLAYNSAGLSNLFSARKEFKAPESRWGLFADGGAVLGSQKSTVNQTGFDFTLAGFTAGADYRVIDNLLLGLATGYSHTSSGFYGSGGNVNVNTIPFNAYAAYFFGPLYAYGSLGYALNLFDLKRGLNFGGLSRTAKSSTTGHQFNAYGEMGYDLKVRRYILTPTVTLAYSRLWVDGFTEKDAGALNLKVGSQTADSLQTGLGGRLTVPFRVGQVKVAPQAYAFYQHEFANGSRGLNASLSQVGGSFTFRTDAAERNFALVGASLTLGLKQNLWVQVNYNAEVGRDNYTAHFVNAGVRYEF